uniref:Protein TIFY n=1 Tax=Kalanchoe fedtschenkoi TaxID=63787 RepID=A0A7N0V397_KALFE
MMAAVVTMSGSGNHAGDSGDRELKKQKPFHDFMGISLSGSGDAPAAAAARISIASDLGSERHSVTHLEGVPFYGPRSDGSRQHTTDRSAGSYKRSNSDSAYVGQDAFDGVHFVKMYRGVSGGDQPRRLNDEEIFHGSKVLRPASTSQALPRYSANWDRAVPVNVARNTQYPSYMSPFVHQVSPNTFRDAATGPSVVSHVAGDEGSRNGIKGSGILNSMKPSMAADENNPKSGARIAGVPSGALVAGSKSMSGGLISEPEAPISGQTGSTSANRQMTIFYDGYAHVFDDVHPTKADVIMALAGCNSESWPSTVPVKSSNVQVKEGSNPTGEIETGADPRGKPSTAAGSNL